MVNSSTVKSQSRPSRRAKRRQCRWRVFGAAVVLTSLPTSAHSLLERPRKRQQESLSISSSKTKSATHADSNLHSWNKSTRMADQDDLVHQILSSSSDDFANRLLNELVNDNSIASNKSSKSSSHPLESMFLYGIVTLALASALLTPTTFTNSLVAMLSSVALLVPWLWLGRASLFTKESVVMVITTMIQLAPRYWEGGDSVVFRKVLPVAGDLLQKMLIAEAWSRIWRIAGRSITKFFQYISLQQHSNDNNNESQDEQGHLPQFVYSIHEFLDASIRKGTSKAVLKTLERNVHSAVGTTFESVWSVMETAVLPLVLIPLQSFLPSLNSKECSL